MPADHTPPDLHPNPDRATKPDRPTQLHDDITALVATLNPTDPIGREHRSKALAWLATTADIFRRAKPATPSPHLVSYFLLVDRSAERVLLCDHRAAGLWLPTGGHVEPGEHPWHTVLREAMEELRLHAVADPVTGPAPFFLTVTQTRDRPERRHTDVSLWFALRAGVEQPLEPDPQEFAGIRWWSPAEISQADPQDFDPHLGRALQALRLSPGLSHVPGL